MKNILQIFDPERKKRIDKIIITDETIMLVYLFVATPSVYIYT